MAKQKQVSIGIDLGGSNINAIAFDADYAHVFEDKIDTEARDGYKHVIARLQDQLERIEKAVREAGYSVEAVGLGVPGLVSAGSDLVKIAPNLQWENVRPFVDMKLTARKDLRIRLVNDVNAGLMGELTRIKSNPKIVAAYFCGTGIGGAVAIDGKLITGHDGGAGEVGHMMVLHGGRRCSCGRDGCLEAYIGKWALNRKIQQRMKSSKRTELQNLIKYNLKKMPVKSSTLKKAYEAGDKFTLYLMNEYYSKFLAAGISQTVNLLSPDLIVLGGGIMESLGQKLLPHILKYLAAYCINTPPALRLAELGDAAGPLGSAYMARNS